MGIKSYKPYTPGFRHRITLDYGEITTEKPQKALSCTINKSNGRNNQGRITVRHRSAGIKRKYRFIDFYRDKIGVPGVIETIEYDPFRTSNIALVKYADGERRYIIAPSNTRVGDLINTGDDAEIKPGNTLPLSKIPTGSTIHNIEMDINGRAKIARAAGAFCVLLAKDGDFAAVKLPSGEVRQINLKCKATIGQVSNLDHRNTIKGKAGITRKLGFRPTVRGSVMNPCDHPHGGGEGRAPIGRSGPLTPWGKPALGYKTRNPKKLSSKRIIKRRK